MVESEFILSQLTLGLCFYHCCTSLVLLPVVCLIKVDCPKIQKQEWVSQVMRLCLVTKGDETVFSYKKTNFCQYLWNVKKINSNVLKYSLLYCIYFLKNLSCIILRWFHQRPLSCFKMSAYLWGLEVLIFFSFLCWVPSLA